MAFRSWSWVALALAVGCGARSSLELSEQGSVSSGAGAGTTSSVTATSGAGGGLPPVVPCTYALSGDPQIAVSFSDRHAISAQLLTTNGDPASGPLEVAIEYIASGGSSPLHPENPVTRIQLEPGSADLIPGATVVAGIESHSYGLLARNEQRMALAWYSDAPGLNGVSVRTIDVDDNQLGPARLLEPGSFSVSAVVAGPSLVGSELAGQGFAVAWRRPADPNQPATRAMAILDADATVVAGPHEVTPALDTPPSPSLVWTGDSYLIANAYGPDCPMGETLCTPDAVTIHRYQPPVPDAEPIVAVTAISVRPGESARRAQLAHYDGNTILVWEETTPEKKDLRLVLLDPRGEPLGPPITVETLDVDDRWTVHTSDQGIAVAYLRIGDDDGPPGQPGAAFLHVLALDEDGTLIGTTSPVPITLPQGGSPSIASLGGEPRSLAIAWSGLGPEGLDVSFIARLRCVDGS